MKILVTGVNGFIDKKLIEKLSKQSIDFILDMSLYYLCHRR